MRVIAVDKKNGVRWALQGLHDKVFREVAKVRSTDRPVYYNADKPGEVHPPSGKNFTIEVED